MIIYTLMIVKLSLKYLYHRIPIQEKLVGLKFAIIFFSHLIRERKNTQIAKKFKNTRKYVGEFKQNVKDRKLKKRG